MLSIALTPASRDGATIAVKMAGVILASLSAGAGELSFMGLTHFYGHFSLAAWGSGTGGAGLVGAGAYVIATTTMGLSVRTSLLVFSFLPIIMLISFFIILPRGPLKMSKVSKGLEYERIHADEPSDESSNEFTQARDEEQDSLLSTSIHSSSARSFSRRPTGAWSSFKANLARSRGLFFP